MSDSSLTPTGSEPQAPQHDGKPPRIPIERHVVASVQALERIKSNAEQALVVMRYCNFDDPSISQHIKEVHYNTEELCRAYSTYLEVIECEGQA